MANFSHLEQLNIKERTVPYTINQIMVNGKSPTLILASATEANPQYFNALLKRVGKSARKARAGTINVEAISENRNDDKELYPSCIVRGWEDTLDADGQEVPFSKEDCAKFLSCLPDWIFDDLRNFAGDPANFAGVLDIEVISKN